MRLFEAEELKKAFVNKGQHSRRYHIGDFWELNFKEICEVLNDAPTVKAIPIERINDWLNTGRNARYFIPMMELIKEWEAENDSK